MREEHVRQIGVRHSRHVGFVITLLIALLTLFTTQLSLSQNASALKLPSKLTPSSVIYRSAVELQDLQECLPYTDLSLYKNHEYEVCTAYIANSATVALQGLYKYGNSRVSYITKGAVHHFETRYWGQPRMAAEQQVASWPKTVSVKGNLVVQKISLTSLTSQLSLNRGYVTTSESWRVTSANGNVLLDEPTHQVASTMCRVKLPGHVLHEWVVAAQGSTLQAVDCVTFAQSNGLEI